MHRCAVDAGECLAGHHFFGALGRVDAPLLEQDDTVRAAGTEVEVVDDGQNADAARCLMAQAPEEANSVGDVEVRRGLVEE